MAHRRKSKLVCTAANFLNLHILVTGFAKNARPKYLGRNMTEAQLHKSIVDWLRLIKPDCFWTTIEHGASGVRQASRNKRRGVIGGLPDLMFVTDGLAFFIQLNTIYILSIAPGAGTSLTLGASSGIPDLRLSTSAANRSPAVW